MDAMRTAKFKNNMKIDEKHIALSLMNNDKKANKLKGFEAF